MTYTDPAASLLTYQTQATAYPLPTLTEQEQIIGLAQAGCPLARETIITGCLGYVLAVARRLSITYAMDYDELVGIGNLVLVEKLDLALTKSNAYAYLKGYVKWQLIHECHQSRYFAQEMDRLAGPNLLLVPKPQPDYSPLYGAVNKLPQRQRQAVMQYYGIMGEGRHSLYQLSLLASASPKGTVMYSRLQRAETKLRKLLEPAYGYMDVS